jgi:hypothetical protein
MFRFLHAQGRSILASVIHKGDFQLDLKFFQVFFKEIELNGHGKNGRFFVESGDKNPEEFIGHVGHPRRYEGGMG